MKKSEVIDHFKTQRAVSLALTAAGYRISQAAISKWGEGVPELWARRLSDITAGALAFDEHQYRTRPAA